MRVGLSEPVRRAGSGEGGHSVVWPGELALDLPRFGGRVIGRDTDNIKTGDIGLSLDEAKTLINAMAVKGTVNRLIGRRLGKGQHMCWTKRGAHLLLQVRCAVLNGELLQRYQRWFPAVGTRQVGLPWHWLPHHS
jgi:hypothetical protein